MGDDLLCGRPVWNDGTGGGNEHWNAPIKGITEAIAQVKSQSASSNKKSATDISGIRRHLLGSVALIPINGRQKTTFPVGIVTKSCKKWTIC